MQKREDSPHKAETARKENKSWEIKYAKNITIALNDGGQAFDDREDFDSMLLTTAEVLVSS